MWHASAPNRAGPPHAERGPLSQGDVQRLGWRCEASFIRGGLARRLGRVQHRLTEEPSWHKRSELWRKVISQREHR
jgi:hypothetical protein